MDQKISINSLTERRLILADVSKALLLSQEANWNQTARDWQMMLTHGEGFGFETQEKRLVATALTLPHGNRVGWISMVLVTRDFQKQGLATRLLQICIESLKHRNMIPLLDATEAGRPVYTKLGFQSLYGFHRLMRKSPPERGGPGILQSREISTQLITESELPEIASFDKEIFGADRFLVLRHLWERQQNYALIAYDNDTAIKGFMMAREGIQALQLGPIVARDSKTAILIAGRALKDIREPVYIDALDRHQTFLTWLKEQGFVPQRSFTRMYLGTLTEFDQPNCIFATAGPELG
ncbi:MAG: GNAT family N-acetyltransferase [SAR324 cluster bacterium]|nr:GNAT family N-acetyltransferase [SAR324 cluster bacterium]